MGNSITTEVWTRFGSSHMISLRMLEDSLLINLGEKSPPCTREAETHGILSPAVLEPEHGHEVKARRPEAPTCLGFR